MLRKEMFSRILRGVIHILLPLLFISVLLNGMIQLDKTYDFGLELETKIERWVHSAIDYEIATYSKELGGYSLTYKKVEYVMLDEVAFEYNVYNDVTYVTVNLVVNNQSKRTIEIKANNFEGLDPNGFATSEFYIVDGFNEFKEKEVVPAKQKKRIKIVGTHYSNSTSGIYSLNYKLGGLLFKHTLFFEYEIFGYGE